MSEVIYKEKSQKELTCHVSVGPEYKFCFSRKKWANNTVLRIYSYQIAVGEALLNDGMALVLFEALIRPDFDTPVKIIYYFFRVIFISPFLGCAFGVGEKFMR